MKAFRRSGGFGKALLIGLFALFGPPLAYLLFVALTDDFTRGGFLIQLGTPLFFAMIISVTLGSFWMAGLGLIWCAHVLRYPERHGRQARLAALAVGGTYVAAAAFLAYVPAGPDACSRAWTDTRYETCLESLFADMSVAEAQEWLTENGYRTGISIDDPLGAVPRDDRHRANPDYRPTMHFQAFRDRGPFRSVPYGTNFNRVFARIPPAPSRFELLIHGDTGRDRILSVDAWWAFTFL